VEAFILGQMKGTGGRYVEELAMTEKKHEGEIEELWMVLKGKTGESTVEDVVEMY
jgi:hypothetical protein